MLKERGMKIMKKKKKIKFIYINFNRFLSWNLNSSSLLTSSWHGIIFLYSSTSASAAVVLPCPLKLLISGVFAVALGWKNSGLIEMRWQRMVKCRRKSVLRLRFGFGLQLYQSGGEDGLWRHRGGYSRTEEWSCRMSWAKWKWIRNDKTE